MGSDHLSLSLSLSLEPAKVKDAEAFERSLQQARTLRDIDGIFFSSTFMGRMCRLLALPDYDVCFPRCLHLLTPKPRDGAMALEQESEGWTGKISELKKMHRDEMVLVKAELTAQMHALRCEMVTMKKDVIGCIHAMKDETTQIKSAVHKIKSDQMLQAQQTDEGRLQKGGSTRRLGSRISLLKVPGPQLLHTTTATGGSDDFETSSRPMRPADVINTSASLQTLHEDI